MRLRRPSPARAAGPGHGGRVLLVSLEPIAARIGGAAARVLEMARALGAAGCSVTVATPSLLPDASPQPFTLCSFERSRPRAALAALVAACDVVVLPFHGLFEIPFLAGCRVPLVFDLYDPLILEILEATGADDGAAARRLARVTVAILGRVLERGDFFVCASERQRDLWLGALLARGRIVRRDPEDPSLRGLIDVVPFGIPPTDPLPAAARHRPLRDGERPIPAEAFVLLWGGGLWPWLDPLTAIRAVALLRDRLDVRLVFLGVKHPTPGRDVDDAADARRLVRELGVEERVRFLDGWIPYDDRGQYLLEGDAGVSAHHAHLESRFAFRTRVMDYLWAGLPVICSAGDVLADMVQREALGIVVPAGDAPALAAAIARLAEDRDFAAACRRQIASVRPRLTWDVAVRPLARFCAEPRRVAVDRRSARARLAGTMHLARVAFEVLTAQGVREAGRRARRLLPFGAARWPS